MRKMELVVEDVRPSADWIAEHAQDVSVAEFSAVVEVAKIWSRKICLSASGVPARTTDGLGLLIPANPGAWRSHPLHPQRPDSKALDFIFVLDCMNFCFWPPTDGSPPYSVDFAVERTGAPVIRYTGYWSLCAALQRALREGIPVTSAQWMASASQNDVDHVFRSDTSTAISHRELRMQILNESGRVLLSSFGGSFAAVVRAARGSARRLVQLVYDHFPSFRDEAEFAGRRVRFLKRAQILAADIWSCFDGSGFGLFEDISTLTMFADYRVPQALRHLGLLRVSDALDARLRAGELLAPGCREEVELRGCSIVAVERLVEAIHRTVFDLPVVAVAVDFWLWDYAKDHSEALAEIPIHRTYWIFY